MRGETLWCAVSCNDCKQTTRWSPALTWNQMRSPSGRNVVRLCSGGPPHHVMLCRLGCKIVPATCIDCFFSVEDESCKILPQITCSCQAADLLFILSSLAEYAYAVSREMDGYAAVHGCVDFTSKKRETCLTVALCITHSIGLPDIEKRHVFTHVPLSLSPHTETASTLMIDWFASGSDKRVSSTAIARCTCQYTSWCSKPPHRCRGTVAENNRNHSMSQLSAVARGCPSMNP